MRGLNATRALARALATAGQTLGGSGRGAHRIDCAGDGTGEADVAGRRTRSEERRVGKECRCRRSPPSAREKKQLNSEYVGRRRSRQQCKSEHKIRAYERN